MDTLPKIGRFLFAIPMAGFGVLHFLMGDAMAGMVPDPGRGDLGLSHGCCAARGGYVDHRRQNMPSLRRSSWA